MKASEVLELIRAGYTKEEIASLDNTTESAAEGSATTPTDTTRTDPGQAAAPEASPQAAGQSSPAAQPAAAAPAASAAPADGITAVLAEMTKTLQAIQAANVSSSSNPGPKDSAEKSKEILANIIAPPKKGK